MFKEVDNKDFRSVQNKTMRESVFKQILRLRKQQIAAANFFGRDQRSFKRQIETMSIDMEEQLMFIHKMVEVVERTIRKMWLTLLQCNAVKPEISYAQVRMIARKGDQYFFLQIFYVNYNFQKLV